MTPPAWAKNCLTHFNACDCRQWRAEQIEDALKVIRMWARIDVEQERSYYYLDTLRSIVQKVDEVLNDSAL